ncbi:efflux RND transporter periplasmic adaptor subunit [Rhodocyclaceae bacterium SMB388]
MKRMVIMLIGVGVLFGGVFGFKYFVGGQIDAFFDNMPEPVASITATEVLETEWTDRLEAVGTFAAVQGTLLTSEVAGIVREIRFDSGSSVEAGAALLVLDSDTDQARLRNLEATERLARVELERAKRLIEQRTLPEAELPRRQSELDQAVAAVAEQRARLQQKTITAPFAGEIGIRRVSLGQYLAAGDPVVSLQTSDPIHIDFTLSERHLARLEKGQPVTAYVDAEQGSFDGRIIAIEPGVRESTRSFAVQAELPNTDGRLRPGMFGRVQVVTGAPRTVSVVPQSAIRFNPYGNIVFVLGEDADGALRVSQRFVQTGARRGDLIEIVEGLEPGERIATSGLLKLRNQARVAVSDDPAVQPTADPDPRPANT